MSVLRVSGAQLDLLVGDISGNVTKIIEAMKEAAASFADVLILPELSIPGYPPEDLLLNSAFVAANLQGLEEITAASKDLNLVVLVGFADLVDPGALGLDAFSRSLANAVAVIHDGKQVGVVHKRLLPTYGVFDEARYFSPSRKEPEIFSIGNINFGIPICEDLWREDVSNDLKELGADILLVPNASPYQRSKADLREKLAKETALRCEVPVVYLASVGGQDELVFDGASVVVNEKGETLHRAPLFKESIFTLDLEIKAKGPIGTVAKKNFNSAPGLIAGSFAERPDELEEVYLALLKGLSAYMSKNRFSSVVLGLSGGIDSAIVAALAADALGGDKVWGIGMPGPYSSGGSVSDAADLAERIGCRFDVLSIKELYETELAILKGTEDNPGPFANTIFDSSEENLQARLRMTLLMSVSNKHGNLLLTTGNKSETSIGYCTLYGDTAGGFAPIKDVYKTLVFDLCEWRNNLTLEDIERMGLKSTVSPIPEATITKPPSAELAPDQRDDQSLPPYPVLDGILERYIERVMSPDDIAKDGFDPAVVSRVCRLVDVNEYKRRQAAPGVKITRCSFGRDRRLPITNAWRPTVSEATISREISAFPTKAEIESILSVKFNALGISSWWETPAVSLDEETPSQLFHTDPERVAIYAHEALRKK